MTPQDPQKNNAHRFDILVTVSVTQLYAKHAPISYVIHLSQGRKSQDG
jgi:hypothetical protein